MSEAAPRAEVQGLRQTWKPGAAAKAWGAGGGGSLRVRRRASICCAVGGLGWLNVACAMSRRNCSRERLRPACIALEGGPPPLLRVALPTAAGLTARPLPALLGGAGATGAGIARLARSAAPRPGWDWRLVARGGWQSLRDGCLLCFSAEESVDRRGGRLCWQGLTGNALQLVQIQVLVQAAGSTNRASSEDRRYVPCYGRAGARLSTSALFGVAQAQCSEQLLDFEAAHIRAGGAEAAWRTEGT